MKIINSFKYAISGFWHCVKHERNFRIHLIAAILIIGFSAMLDMSRAEFSLLLFAIALVLVCEMFNTAIERVNDAANKQNRRSDGEINDETQDFYCKISKDVAAGAVLVSAVFASVVGFVILVPAAISAIRLFFNL